MTATMLPYVFRDGQLDPKAINENFRVIGSELDDLKSRRYFHCPIHVDFGEVGSADNAAEVEHIGTVPSVSSLEVIGVEVFCYAATSQSFTLTLEVSGVAVAGWNDITITGAGATTLAYKAANCNAKLASLDEFSVKLNSYGTASHFAVTLHTRHCRFDGVLPSDYSPVQVDASNTDSAATLNAGLDNADTELDTEESRRKAMRCTHMLLARNKALGTYSNKLPSFGGTLLRLDVSGYANGASTGTVTMKDEAAASVGTAASWSSSGQINDQINNITDTQGIDDPTDTNDDYDLEISASGAGDLTMVSAFVWWWD